MHKSGGVIKLVIVCVIRVLIVYGIRVFGYSSIDCLWYSDIRVLIVYGIRVFEY